MSEIEVEDISLLQEFFEVQDEPVETNSIATANNSSSTISEMTNGDASFLPTSSSSQQSQDNSELVEKAVNGHQATKQQQVEETPLRITPTVVKAVEIQSIKKERTNEDGVKEYFVKYRPMKDDWEPAEIVDNFHDIVAAYQSRMEKQQKRQSEHEEVSSEDNDADTEDKPAKSTKATPRKAKQESVDTSSSRRSSRPQIKTARFVDEANKATTPGNSTSSSKKRSAKAKSITPAKKTPKPSTPARKTAKRSAAKEKETTKQEPDQPEQESDSGEEFEVEMVLGRKVDKNGILKYYVKWDGYDESWNSWEPAEGLQHLKVIQDYDKEHPQSSGKKSQKATKSETTPAKATPSSKSAKSVTPAPKATPSQKSNKSVTPAPAKSPPPAPSFISTPTSPESEGDEKANAKKEDEVDVEELGDEEYYAERIVAKRITKKKGSGGAEYLIKWENFDDSHNTWETYANIQHLQLLKDYESELKKQKRGKSDGNAAADDEAGTSNGGGAADADETKAPPAKRSRRR